MAVHLRADLVLEAVEHEANNAVTSIDYCRNDEDQDHQDDPQAVFIWALFEDCLKTTDGHFENAFENT